MFQWFYFLGSLMQTIGENKIKLLLGGVFHHPKKSVFYLPCFYLRRMSVKCQHSNRKPLNEINFSSDETEHISCYGWMVGSKKEPASGQLWQLPVMPTVCVWMPLKSSVGSSQIKNVKQNGRKGILFHQFCWLHHPWCHEYERGFSLLFQQFL